MTILPNISLDLEVIKYLSLNKDKFTSISATNSFLEEISGIKDFLNTEEELQALIIKLNNKNLLLKEDSRKEYGDFQTNRTLTENICKLLKLKNISPKLVIEPTCGKGSFILSILANFPNVEKIIGIEIYAPYVWLTKFAILKYFIDNPRYNKPEISIVLESFFNYEFDKKIDQDKELLIIGNPPWVTSSLLSVLDSDNLPKKSNFKNHTGMDAITGKGNFDIGEYITLKLLANFSNHKGNLAFLVKNSVIKNILSEQLKNQFNIGNIEQYNINTKKEFEVSVEASLFLCDLQLKPEIKIKVLDFYSQMVINEYGWIDNKFVSDISKYKKYSDLDGLCTFEWRQGVKHDCSEIMEFEKEGNFYINSKNERFILENNLVYPLLKSSDLKGTIIAKTRKYTIITQEKVGQDTFYIQAKYPQTYSYLLTNKDFFEKR